MTIKSWRRGDIGEWLHNLGLQSYEQAFRDHVSFPFTQVLQDNAEIDRKSVV